MPFSANVLDTVDRDREVPLSILNFTSSRETDTTQIKRKRVWSKGSPSGALMVGMKIDAATVENSMEVP